MSARMQAVLGALKEATAYLHDVQHFLQEPPQNHVTKMVVRFEAIIADAEGADEEETV